MDKKAVSGSTWGAWSRVVGVAVGIVAARTIPGLGIVILIFFVSALLAAWYARWYMGRAKINEEWLRLLFWSNVVTWFLPVVGFFTSMVTYNINSANHGEDRTKYMGLAAIGFVLSFANSLYGVFLHSR